MSRKITFIYYYLKTSEYTFSNILQVLRDRYITHFSQVEVYDGKLIRGFHPDSGYYEINMDNRMQRVVSKKFEERIQDIYLNDKQYNAFVNALDLYKWKPYNSYGAFFNFIPLVSRIYYYDAQDSEMFGSEYIVKCMIKAGLLPPTHGYIPSKISPDDLFTLVKKEFIHNLKMGDL